MYADLDYSAFANLNLRHFETESAEQRPPSLLPQTPALLPSSEQANHDFLGEDICTLRRSTCRGIVSKLRYSKYNKGRKRKYRKHLEGGEGSCRDCIARRRLAESSSTASSTASLSVPASMPASSSVATFLLNRSMNKIITQTERSVPSAPVHEEQNPAIPMHEMVEKTLGRTGGVYDKTFRTVPIRLRVRTVKSYLVYYISILNLPQS